MSPSRMTAPLASRPIRHEAIPARALPLRGLPRTNRIGLVPARTRVAPGPAAVPSICRRALPRGLARARGRQFAPPDRKRA